MEFILSIVREGDGEGIIRYWQYFIPLFKCSDRTNYSVEAFNLLFEYEYALTPRMKQQVMHVGAHNQYAWQTREEHLNGLAHGAHKQECNQAMGSLGSNIGDTAVSRIGRSIGELMKAILLTKYEKNPVNSHGIRVQHSWTWRSY